MRLCENRSTHRILALASDRDTPCVPLSMATAPFAGDGRCGAAEDRPPPLGNARAAAHSLS